MGIFGVFKKEAPQSLVRGRLSSALFQRLVSRAFYKLWRAIALPVAILVRATSRARERKQDSWCNNVIAEQILRLRGKNKMLGYTRSKTSPLPY